MLSQYIRVIHSDNGVLTDYSLEAQEKSSVIAVPLVAAEDYIYIGQYLAFNNIFLEVGGTANSNASVLTTQSWDGDTWQDAVDVLDATKSSGVTLAQSGVVQWSVNDKYAWKLTTDSKESSGRPTELETLQIYNLYWLRIKVSADLSAGTTLDRLGYKFTDEDALSQLEPDLDNLRASWESTKADWTDQILIASKHVWHDLRNRLLIRDKQNILRFDDVYMATAYRTLAVIYNAFGEEYIQKKAEAIIEYNNIMSGSLFNFDTNNNAIVDRKEISANSSRVYR